MPPRLHGARAERPPGVSGPGEQGEGGIPALTLHRWVQVQGDVSHPRPPDPHAATHGLGQCCWLGHQLMNWQPRGPHQQIN